ncbi:MAG: amidohydrolase family protein [Acidobacteria bacterium]|nr:amidohydrolase family protein [Acidobacteriota bacterium]
MKVHLPAWLLLAAALLFAETPPKPSPTTLVLTNVHLVDVRAGALVPNVTVVVKNGLIDGVGKIALVAPGPGITVLNAAGKYLIPGLWDMHVHSAFAGAAWDENILYPLYLANGVTGIRDMGGDPRLLRQRREHIQQGTVLGPHLVMAGPFLSTGKGDAETIPVNTPEDARGAVDALKNEGVDFLKLLNAPRESYFALAEESRKQKISFVGHVPFSVSAVEASDAGQRSIEHLSGILLACSSQEAELRGKRLEAAAQRDYAAYTSLGAQMLRSYDTAKAARVFATFVKNDTWQTPTFIWTQTNANLEDPHLADDPRLNYVPASVREQWKKAAAREKSSATSQLEKAEAARDVQLIHDLHEARVPILAGTDGPDPYVYPGFSLHDELEWLVKSGFTPLEALQAATLQPAKFLGKQEEYGAIEVGRAADLVLLDANPLEDIRNTRRIFAVVDGGKYYSRADLDKILAQVGELAKSQ